MVTCGYCGESLGSNRNKVMRSGIAGTPSPLCSLRALVGTAPKYFPCFASGACGGRSDVGLSICTCRCMFTAGDRGGAT